NLLKISLKIIRNQFLDVTKSEFLRANPKYHDIKNVYVCSLDCRRKAAKKAHFSLAKNRRL
ncbi:MAG: hypothetical protein MJZ99_09340, partial [Bacteroidales bacterium]|nr:hypothetical protein [Bacteroidales bacterium]